MSMVQSRASLLEQAVATALGGNRQLVLEASSGTVAPTPLAAASTPKPITPPVIQPIAPPATSAAAINQPKPEDSAKVDPIPAPAPVAAPVASPKPVVPARAPLSEQPTAHPVDPRPTPDPQAPPAVSVDIDRHAKTLANFFNGDVLTVDDIESTPVNEATKKTPNTPQ